LLEKQGGTTTATYTFGNALVRKDGETPLYDGLGTTRTETSSTQAVTFTLTPDAFGNSVASTGSTGSSYGFAGTSGYRTDGDAGLMKVGARYYDPQVGSFTTRDTDLDEQPYLYCEHDPVNATDPSGHMPEWLRRLIRFVGGPLTGETEPPPVRLPLDPPGIRRGPPEWWTPEGPPAPSCLGKATAVFGEFVDGLSKGIEPLMFIVIPEDMYRLGNRGGGRES
jgi:RHS repeat-associated protein